MHIENQKLSLYFIIDTISQGFYHWKPETLTKDFTTENQKFSECFQYRYNKPRILPNNIMAEMEFYDEGCTTKENNAYGWHQKL